MDAIILCGGKGTRLNEETLYKPKPMVEIGGKPILWHIMKSYSYYGINRFILALGYKGHYIKQYFYNYKITDNDFSIKLEQSNKPKYMNQSDEKDWEIVFVDTGEETLKGGRIKRLEKYIKSDLFHLTYGDGVSDVDIRELSEFHNSHNCIGTVTAVRPLARFGAMDLERGIVKNFIEKPITDKGWVNGGFFVVSQKVMTYIKSCQEQWETGPLPTLVKEKNLAAFKHEDFWQPMDTLREKQILCDLWNKGKAPWKTYSKIKNIYHISDNVKQA